MGTSAKALAGSAMEGLPPPDKLSGYKGGPAEPDGDEGSEGDEQMGSALADAVKSGDGAAITSAFRDLMNHCG